MTTRRVSLLVPQPQPGVNAALEAVTRARYRDVIIAIASNVAAGMNPVAARREAVRRVFPHTRTNDARDAKARRVLAGRVSRAALAELGVADEVIAALLRSGEGRADEGL